MMKENTSQCPVQCFFSRLANELKDLRDAYREAESVLEGEMVALAIERLIEAVELRELELGR